MKKLSTDLTVEQIDRKQLASAFGRAERFDVGLACDTSFNRPSISAIN